MWFHLSAIESLRTPPIIFTFVGLEASIHSGALILRNHSFLRTAGIRACETRLHTTWRSHKVARALFPRHLQALAGLALPLL